MTVVLDWPSKAKIAHIKEKNASEQQILCSFCHAP
jgi:hypothetical protein